MAKLTPKQHRFVEEYQRDLNATQAAVRAGYSQKTAYSAGQRLLKHVEVSSELEAAQKRRSERSEISVDKVINELGSVAFDEHELTRDRLRALELLGKALGMFVDRSVSATLDIGPGGMGATEELIASLGESELASLQDPLRLSS